MFTKLRHIIYFIIFIHIFKLNFQEPHDTDLRVSGLLGVVATPGLYIIKFSKF